MIFNYWFINNVGDSDPSNIMFWCTKFAHHFNVITFYQRRESNTFYVHYSIQPDESRQKIKQKKNPVFYGAQSSKLILLWYALATFCM